MQGACEEDGLQAGNVHDAQNDDQRHHDAIVGDHVAVCVRVRVRGCVCARACVCEVQA